MVVRFLANALSVKKFITANTLTKTALPCRISCHRASITFARHYSLSRSQIPCVASRHKSPRQFPSFASLQLRSFSSKLPPTSPPNTSDDAVSEKPTATLRENIYTIPNFLTATRILACPVLGYSIAIGDFELASGLLVYAAATDLLDGWLARRFNMGTVLGTILDPAADKALMTTLTVTLAAGGMIPIPLAAIILGRDVALSFTAFYYRYISLPPPKTWARYWNFSLPSAEVHPTGISKVNTALQLILMTGTVFNPILPFALDTPLIAMQWVVGGTTIWSGLSYVWSKDAVKILSKKANKP
ncbi:hypothetical protein FRB93_000016 [Tulasnella sp. JGI-2019a]|nr:hypothetical protein FRB93_000016 [Tulasnella sp. JGI-2019a]